MKKLLTEIKQGRVEECFPSEESCLEFIASQKWQDGFVCRNCGHDNYCKGKSPHSRRCTRCKHEESATAHTIFHNSRIPLQKAFMIISMICDKPEISSYKISDALNIRQMTCWKFKKKITTCMEQQLDLSDYEKLKKLMSGKTTA
ncbi:MAG: transposase [Bacteroidales bacterium]|nr:transposase [Bacteroidales bacterium]MCF8344462.1 transposase [Bacteroidales bacterium]MCF8349689.1 transposase [Bacteroidales bacterium]MCF8374935.1 transposase [Bacteroidales bacterium]MCF8400086.1 transposase [Bacteroidales bacterium]